LGRAEFDEQRMRFSPMRQRGLLAFLLPKDIAEHAQRFRLLEPTTHLGAEGRRTLSVLPRAIQVAQRQMRLRELVQCPRLVYPAAALMAQRERLLRLVQ